MTAITDPTQASPVEIDTELAVIWQTQAHAERQRDQLRDRLDNPAHLQVEYQVQRMRDALSAAERTITDCETRAGPLTAEYQRRGGWTRAWLVTNSNGHVHRSMRCATCFPTTEFAWLTHLSGHHETEIVELAGQAACTTCYPSAPVDIRQRPSRIKTPAQIQREAQKAERAKLKAAEGITAPNGTELCTREYGTLTSEVTARRSYADSVAYTWFLSLNASRNRILIASLKHDADAILAALAAKHSRTVDDVRDELSKAVEARWKREYRHWT